MGPPPGPTITRSTDDLMRSSASALATISGPIPRTSPSVTARRGRELLGVFVNGKRNHGQLETLNARASAHRPARNVFPVFRVCVVRLSMTRLSRLQQIRLGHHVRLRPQLVEISSNRRHLNQVRAKLLPNVGQRLHAAFG